MAGEDNYCWLHGTSLNGNHILMLYFILYVILANLLREICPQVLMCCNDKDVSRVSQIQFPTFSVFLKIWMPVMGMKLKNYKPLGENQVTFTE